MIVRKFLIVTGRGDMRVVTRAPRLSFDEVAFPIRVTIPDSWGKVYRDLNVDIEFPEGPEPTVHVEGPELPIEAPAVTEEV